MADKQNRPTLTRAPRGEGLQPTGDEILAEVRQSFPREFEIAALRVQNRKQAEALAQCDAEAAEQDAPESS